MSATSRSSTFHHRPSTLEGECRCPIHDDGAPFTAPLGWSFASHVSVEEISREQAEEIYREHHSYKTSLPDVNIAHHGLYFQGELMGAITYRFPLLGAKRVHFGSNGTVKAKPYSESDFQSLPKPIRATARDIIPNVDENEIVESPVFNGDAFIELARICIGVNMPNFASAALARSQVKFVEEHKHRFDNFQFLLTYVRSDYPGSMIRALRDKGWTTTGFSEPSEATNRDPMEIRKKFKWVFLNSVDSIEEQAALSDFE